MQICKHRCNSCNKKVNICKRNAGFVEEIHFTSAKVECIHYMQEVLLCPECKKDHDVSFKNGVAPAALIPHSPISASSVIYVMFQKCFMGLTYYRLEAAMKQFRT